MSGRAWREAQPGGKQGQILTFQLADVAVGGQVGMVAAVCRGPVVQWAHAQWQQDSRSGGGVGGSSCRAARNRPALPCHAAAAAQPPAGDLDAARHRLQGTYMVRRRGRKACHLWWIHPGTRESWQPAHLPACIRASQGRGTPHHEQCQCRKGTPCAPSKHRTPPSRPTLPGGTAACRRAPVSRPWDLGPTGAVVLLLGAVAQVLSLVAHRPCARRIQTESRRAQGSPNTPAQHLASGAKQSTACPAHSCGP